MTGLQSVKFKVTHRITKESALLSLNDLYAYEGEVCGILIRNEKSIPESLQGEAISYRSGYDGSSEDNNKCYENENLIIEPYKMNIRCDGDIAQPAHYNTLVKFPEPKYYK